MNAHNTETGSELNIARSTRHRKTSHTGFRFLSRPLLHARALLRLARRRSLLALGLAVGTGSAICAVGAAATLEAIPVAQRTLAASIAPLAPAPKPPTPSTERATEHHHPRLHLPIHPLRGLASWYGSMWNGRMTASGEPFDETKMTAAHKTLPLGTLVRVTNLSSQQSVVVRINARGSLAPNRVIDLSSAAAREIGLLGHGLARVKLEILSRT